LQFFAVNLHFPFVGSQKSMEHGLLSLQTMGALTQDPLTHESEVQFLPS